MSNNSDLIHQARLAAVQHLIHCEINYPWHELIKALKAVGGDVEGEENGKLFGTTEVYLFEKPATGDYITFDNKDINGRFWTIVARVRAVVHPGLSQEDIVPAESQEWLKTSPRVTLVLEELRAVPSMIAAEDACYVALEGITSEDEMTAFNDGDWEGRK